MNAPTNTEAFIAAKADIDAMLNALKALSDDHFGVGPDDVLWTHVGSLNHVAELLREVCDFIAPEFAEGHSDRAEHEI